MNVTDIHSEARSSSGWPSGLDSGIRTALAKRRYRQLPPFLHCCTLARTPDPWSRLPQEPATLDIFERRLRS